MAVLRELREEEAERLTGRKFEFYEPNGKCEEYIRAVGSGENFVTFFSAANGVGKTAASANILAHIIFSGQSDNPYFDGPLYRDWPHPKRGRIVTEPNNIPGVIEQLKEWFPLGKYRTSNGTKSYEAKWSAGSWKFEIMSYEQSAKEFEGATLGFVWFDEPPPYDIYKANISRLRMGGIMFISATPLKGSGWMYDAFAGGKMESEGLDGKAVRRSVKYIEADVESACRQHGVRGHLEHANIEKMIAEYTDEEKQARAYGKFQHLMGLVFKRFERRIHVIRPFEISPRDFCVYEALDPHPRNPDAVMWLAVDRKQRKFVVDELFAKCEDGTDELATRILAKANSYRVVSRIADPSAFVDDQHRDRTVAAKLSDKGLDYVEATKFRAQADKRIGDALAFQRLPSGEFVREPEFYIFDTCQRTIFEIEHYIWDEWRGRSASERNPKEKPVDKDDHMIENLGRLLLMEPTFEAERRVQRRTVRHNDDPYD